MKLFLLFALSFSFSGFASETKLLTVDAKKAGRGSLSSKFVVDLNEQIHGVTVSVSRKVGAGRSRRTVTKTFFKAVPELSLSGETLEMNIDGAIVECGTMGETRVFRLPVLRLNGNCDLVAKRNVQNANVEVILITK